MDATELAAREAIRELVARYAQLIDRARIDDVVALFTADGVLEANDHPPARGHDAIRAFFDDARTRLAAATTRPFIRHHVSTLTIDVLGSDDAEAAAYFLVVTDVGPDHWGRYRDRLARVDGRWLFRHRRVRTDGATAGARLGRG